MSVAIQNKFFADNGQPISGATVQAILTNGTTSSVSATDTTTVDGLWAFDTSVAGHQVSLADTDATHWYDFKIIYGSIVRWHYGGVKLFVRAINLAQGVVANATTTFDFTAASVVVKMPLALTTSGGLLLTLPTTADTLVGRATTDTLTNKTLTSPVLNGATGTTLSLSGTATAAAFSGPLTGNVTGNVSGSAGTAGSATTAGTVTTPAQPAITSTGVLAALHMTSPVVDSGGVTVSSGGVAVTGTNGVVASVTGFRSAKVLSLVVPNATATTVVDLATLIPAFGGTTGTVVYFVGSATSADGNFQGGSGRVTMLPNGSGAWGVEFSPSNWSGKNCSFTISGATTLQVTQSQGASRTFDFSFMVQTAAW